MNINENTIKYIDKYTIYEQYEIVKKDLDIAQRGLVEITNKAEQYWDEKVALEKQVEELKGLLEDASCPNRVNGEFHYSKGCDWCEMKTEALKITER